MSRVFNAETVIEGFLAGTIGVGVTYALCALANSIAYSSFNVENICPALAAYGRRLVRGSPLA